MTGTIALVFLIVGYQIALFINRAAITKILADRSSPDTVFVAAVPRPDSTCASATVPVRRNAVANGTGRAGISGSDGGPEGVIVRRAAGNKVDIVYGAVRKPPRPVENFRFNPNTVSEEDLQRLGFSERQARSIANYRLKGGRFNRKSDFAKSFVVADSVYRRLEPYIDIPPLDLNTADSAALDGLPGIGGYFARKILEYRERLGGFSYKEQLMDIYRFDREKYEGLQDIVFVSPGTARPYPLWTLPEDSLELHPYIGSYSAHGIVLYRENSPREEWTVEALDEAGILRPGMAEKLSRCNIAPPE